jgi:hypothetical protein
MFKSTSTLTDMHVIGKNKLSLLHVELALPTPSSLLDYKIMLI